MWILNTITSRRLLLFPIRLAGQKNFPLFDSIKNFKFENLNCPKKTLLIMNINITTTNQANTNQSTNTNKPDTVIRSTSFTIQRPTKSGSTLFDGIQAKAQPPPPVTPKETPKPTIEIQRPKKNLSSNLFQKSSKTFEELFQSWKKFETDSRNSTSNFQIRSKGYTILMNYVLESGNERPSSRPLSKLKGHKKTNFTHSTSAAELVELNPDRFIPTHLSKTIGQWDETSDKAFRIKVNQTLNSLTRKTMSISLENLKQLISVVSQSPPEQGQPKNMTLQERSDFVIKALVDKATKEQSFSDLYANFTALTDPEFQSHVIKMNNNALNDSIMNPGSEDDEESSLICNGSAKFFSSLAKIHLIEDQDLYDIVKALTDELKTRETPHPTHVEMIHSFYLNIGQEIANLLEKFLPEMWESIEQCMRSPTLKKRFYFLLVDVIEKRDKWIKNIQTKEQVSQKSAQSSTDHMNNVRGAFSTYMDSYSIPEINLKSRDFFYASMDIFPDQSKNNFDFCEFICGALHQMKAQHKDIKTVLTNRVSRFRDQKIENECPYFWANVSTLINMLLIKKLLSLHEAKDIHNNFPEKIWNYENSLKWYIHDYHTFADPIYLSPNDQWPMEIMDALAMPQNIDNLPPEIPMSKLITVSLIRTLNQKFRKYERVDLHSFSRWKSYLIIANERYLELLRTEIDYLLQDLEMSKTVNQVIDYCYGQKP
ncbi:hypothetical protein TRFO_40145 [Tritrichomonas foetus]|uniref:MIF4G domain-containing protein n=1 Tax=Tritrichomonas foetus TaxID=1144522 RepID=A0A1J4J2A4_9EUKA|nr:hypothetical protein TRFO_40145 [Tritrichomonas foetus]|eukprot:OHS93584.1 hypothetical protein TRFO_40145 [Tritrichomonas foetus]